jgi:hypothetical protein
MNFVPKFLPYKEALRLVAERAKIQPGEANPLKLALDEAAIVPELRKNGEWKKARDGEWGSLRVWFENPLVASHQQPEWNDQIPHSDVRVERSEIDKLWPAIEVKGDADDDPESMTPKRRSIIEAVNALFGSVEASKAIPVGTRDGKIIDWLKSNKRAAVDPVTIRRTLATK